MKAFNLLLQLIDELRIAVKNAIRKKKEKDFKEDIEKGDVNSIKDKFRDSN